MSFEVQKVTPPTPELTSYQVGKPDVTEALGVSMEALRWLGLRASEEQLQQDYKSVASLGYDGRLLPVLAQGVIDFEDLLAGAEGKRPEGVPAVYRYDHLWTPGTKNGRKPYQGYTSKELNAGLTHSTGRLMLFNREKTGYDPILHGLGLSYDEMYNEEGQPTQLDLIAQATEHFMTKHPNHSFGPSETKNYLMLALMDRVRGIEPDSPDFILNRGLMRDPQLGRKKLADGSFVGYVNSYDSRLRLDGANGVANSGIGVGLLAGPETA